MPKKGFFAYPSRPSTIPEVIHHAVDTINKSEMLKIQLWEDCAVSGHFIIDTICHAIGESDLFCADLTDCNPNVLFELGYAIARNKKVWLLLDTSRNASRELFIQLNILTTVGYQEYCNSTDIINAFYTQMPHESSAPTIYESTIEKSLDAHQKRTLLFLKDRHNTQANVLLSAEVQKSGLPLTIDDPKETNVTPLRWYAEKCSAALGVLVHFCSPVREGATLHNCKYAFISGLAHGFATPLLMLSESDYQSPIDYREMLSRYQTAADCAERARQWMEPLRIDYQEEAYSAQEYNRQQQMVQGLRGLRLGEYVAENEEHELEGYFVETSSFVECLEGRHTLVVGRKGSGKTANLFVVASRLRQDKRNLVCVLRPVSYELDGLVRLIGGLEHRDQKGYLIEALWKFLVYSELAREVHAQLSQKPGAILPGSPQSSFLKFFADNEELLNADFAVRIERAVARLESMRMTGSIADFRTAISEQLHDTLLRDLRRVLGDALTNHTRVALLVDNLDKAWDKGTNLDTLCRFLLGLLGITREIRQDFARKDHWRAPVTLTLTVFLRTDIFQKVLEIAREPDKIACSRLTWDDPEVLLRVIDERLVRSMGTVEVPERLWGKFFCQQVKGKPTKEYLMSRVLARPRDALFLVRESLATAINRGHARVEESDILKAEEQYSQFAFDSIQVENGISLPELQAVLFEFVGHRGVLSKSDVITIFKKSGLPTEKWDYALSHLCALSFLGTETREDHYAFACEWEDAQKNESLGKKHAEARGCELRYKVNAAFRAFLEISEEN